jgi:hypothetical protein
MLHELRARRGLDLVLGPLFLLPGIGVALRSWYRARLVCGFVAFRDETETTVGCLLHPSRWKGADLRSSAFRLLPGVGCGSADYLCSAARRFHASTPEERTRLSEVVRGLDWYEYSLRASIEKES